jgi:DNA-binding transcriptional MerR regulator
VPAAIPNRPVFRAQEVCEIADVQPYVLRSWEAEFPDLGLAKTPAGPRVYRRVDVERVLRLKHLLFVDGLTLAGARKQLLQEWGASSASPESIADADVAALMDRQTRQVLKELRGGLESILGVLTRNGQAGESAVEFALRAQPAAVQPARKKVSPPARAVATKKAGRAKK